MPFNDAVQGKIDRSHVERSGEPPSPGNKKGCLTGFELFQKPEALLRKGRRKHIPRLGNRSGLGRRECTVWGIVA
jgi:hypothetical protein